MNFSLFSAPITNKIPARVITLAECAELIRGITYQPRTEELRLLLKDEAKKYKAQKLDYVTFCGTFSSRKAENLLKFSGLFCVDFDHVADVAALKQRLIDDPHFAGRLCFVSPSGNGVKFVLEIGDTYPLDVWFNGLYGYFKSIYGVEIDKACKDVSRACFLCHDPDVWYNEERQADKPFVPTDWVVTSSKKIVVNEGVAQDVELRVESVVSMCEKQNVDIAPSYEEWVTLGFALSELGEAGRSYFHRLSQLHGDYDFEKVNKQYKYCLNSKGNGVTIASLFHLAKQQGLAVGGFNSNADCIVSIKDFLNKNDVQNINKSSIVRSRIDQLATDYYKQLTNSFSVDELQARLDNEVGEGYIVSFDDKRIKISQNRKECYIQNILSHELLTKICCEKHIALLEDVLTEDFSFNFTVEELQAWIVDKKPQTIFRGYYYDKTAHCFKSEYGNAYYRIENEILYRLKNLYSSCLNYQKRDFRAVRESVNAIAEAFIAKMYLTKDMEYPDLRYGYYNEILNAKTKDFGKDDIYKFFHYLFDCSDAAIDSLLLFVACTQRVHFMGDVKAYYCLLLTGDSGIGKDSFFPSFCMGMDYMDLEATNYLYKGSLYGTTKFSNISEEGANQLFYNWISDDIESANLVNKLDLINNPYFRIERKKRDPSLLVKRFNTAITANFKDVIFGKSYDPNAIVGRFLFAHFQYREGWKRPQYVDFYVKNTELLRNFYKKSFAWIWQNLAINDIQVDQLKSYKLEAQKEEVFETIYKSEEDYQIYELWNEYYQQQQNGSTGNVIEYKGDKWVYVECASQLHNIFASMRGTPSAKKVSKALALFYREENIVYAPLVSRFGRPTRFTLLVRKGITVKIY